MIKSNISQRLLDALPAHVALLDPAGRIEMVNEAWRKFAADNGLKTAHFGLGLNYLEICDNARGAFAEDAGAIAAGIRAVLRRERQIFEGTYPCPTPSRNFWFRMVVTPVLVDKQRYALVTHTNVTDGAVAQAALAESEHQYHSLATELDMARTRLGTAQAVAKVGGWELDLTSQEVFWSAETYRIFEADPADFVPTVEAIMGFIHPDDRPALGEIVRKAELPGGESGSIQHRLSLPNHRTKHIHATWQTVAGPGAKKMLIGTCQDITETHAVNEKLRESEARLALAQEITGMGSWEIVPQQGRLTLSKQMFHIRGEPVSGHAFAPGDVADFILSDRDKATAWLERLWAGEEVETLEGPIYMASGETRFVINDARAILDQAGRVERIIGTQRDVTEAKEAERELRQSQLHLALAQRVASTGSAAIDFRTGKWDWSDETYRIYGVEREHFTPSAEALGALVHPEDREELLSKPALALQGITPPPIEYRIRRPDGAERILYREATLVWDGDQVIGIVGTVRDVTDLRTAEREKEFLQAQLRQGQRLETVGRMTGGVAHDFNNLLTVILGNAEVLERHLADDSPLRELAEMTRIAAARGAEMVQQLLAFSRQQPLHPQSTSIGDLVAGMKKLLERALGENARLHTSCPADLWPALVDAPQLGNALLNLAVNARDAMPSGGLLTIAMTNVQLDQSHLLDHVQLDSDDSKIVPGQYVRIALSDTGTGMDEITRLRAFDPYFTTKDVGKGSGLGLSMVYGFVRQSKGYVRIVSKLRHGTTVELYLPRAEQQSIQTQPIDEELALPGGCEKLLVVEDDDLVRAQVASQLKTLGYQVTTARNGMEALEQLRTTADFALLFTDIVMPHGISGLELADRALEKHPRLKVLFTSGYSENVSESQGRLNPLHNLLKKPYRRGELATKLRAMLN